MSDNNEQMVNTVNNHQHEEVDYVDPKSLTLAIQSASPTTVPVERLTDVIETDNTADTADMLLPGGAPTLATSTDEAPTTSLPPAASKRGRQISTDTDAMVHALQHEPMKRRRLDLGDLMLC